jgi:membrane protease YdiL (CAAX protease family)
MQTSGTVKQVFRNRAGHLRAGWRILAYAVIVGLIGLTAAGVSRVLHGNVDVESDQAEVSEDERFDSWMGVIGFFIMDFILIVAAFIMLRYIDKRPVGMLGLSISSHSGKELVIGFLLGAGAISASCIIMWVAGAVHLTLGNLNGAYMGAAVRLLLVFLAAAAVEELIMRGYPFQAFAEGAGTPIAIVLFGLIFGLGHMTNSGWSIVGIANTGVSGVLMSLAYLKTRSLWTPIAIHLSWNWTQGCVWGMNVSGLPIDSSLIQTTPVGPAILSGGAFGAEGSLFTLAIVTLLCLYTWKATWLKPSPKNAELWEPYSGSSTEQIDA